MLDFILFRRMLTPVLILWFFWISFIGCLGGGIYLLIEQEIIEGLLILILAPLILRIICECLILFFRINETLTDLRNDKTRGGL